MAFMAFYALTIPSTALTCHPTDTGTVGTITAAPDHVGTGPHPLRQTAPHPHGIHAAPTGDLVYAMDLGTDAVVQYALDGIAGTLAPRGQVHMGDGAGPRGMSFHPSLPVAYVNCELNGTVVVCTVDVATGLVPVQTVACYPAGFVGRDHPQNLGKADFWGAEGCLGGGGRWYYYICRVDQSVAVFAIDPASGTLTARGRHALAKNSNARNMTTDPSGAFLLVASQDADCVEVFRIDPASGTLARTACQDAPCPTDVAVV